MGIDYRLHCRLKGDQTSDWIQVGLMAGTNLRFDPVFEEGRGVEADRAGEVLPGPYD